MKLNLGSGDDRRSGYVNVDVVTPCDVVHDITELPWPWKDGEAEEILMLDVLEHIPYRLTDSVLHEAWRVLKKDGELIVQVPDFEHCANAALNSNAYLCNVCGNSGKNTKTVSGISVCAKCDEPIWRVAESAIKRLYGGQNRRGNWHFNAFTREMLERILKNVGFCNFEYLEKHHQWLNWNFKISARKSDNVWGE